MRDNMTLSILRWRCYHIGFGTHSGYGRNTFNTPLEMPTTYTCWGRRLGLYFQYSVGDAVTVSDGENVVDMVTFQYSVGDALSQP